MIPHSMVCGIKAITASKLLCGLSERLDRENKKTLFYVFVLFQHSLLSK